LLNAWAAYQNLARIRSYRTAHATAIRY
jgi:hypothetical protein